jgi:hypothetical protein
MICKLSVMMVGISAILPGVSRSAVADASPGEIWASDSLTKLMRTARPGDDASRSLLLQGARGEVVSGQVAIHPRRDLNTVSAAITPLRQLDGDTVIQPRSVRLQWVRYIDINRNTAGMPEDELIARAPASIPDPYWEDPTIGIRAGQTQPLWIEVKVPRRASAGDYAGALTLQADNKTTELPVTLHVWDFEVPQQRHLSIVNWWRFPGLGFEDRVEPYSEAYWSLLSRFCEFVAEHRQTDVLAHINLIQETGDRQQGYAYDASRLERFAQTAFAAGIRQIQMHSLGRRIGSHLDPDGRIEPDEAAFRRLAELEELVRNRKWHNRFAVSISDEPFLYHEEFYADLVDRVHKTAPSVRCIEAVETEYLGNLDIYVPKLSHLNLWYDRFDQVRQQGAELWFYTCCHPVGRYPNRFLDQSLLKVRVLHWLNYLYDLDGYLHWGLNFFAGDDPYSQEGISKDLPLGDRAIAYPGKTGLLGSLRFSAQRDGIEDFEYLWVLEERLRETRERVGRDAFWLDPRQRPLELCRRVVWSFHDYTRDSNVLLETRRAIAEEIEQLKRDPLLVVQTSPPEGMLVPAGPRHIAIRGLVSPGASVAVNGRPVRNIRPSGYFRCVHFLADDQSTITILTEHGDRTRAAKRTFHLGQ